MPSLEDGFHEIKVRAKDSVGNWSQYGTHVVEIDTIPPTIPTPTTSSTVNNTNLSGHGLWMKMSLNTK